MKNPMPLLPIDDVLPEICAALNVHTRAILIADPGAGKTTRVPLALSQQEWAKEGKLLVLVPRRLAARAAAIHMAKLCSEAVGQTVGYRVRLESRVSENTKIEFITEGVFTRMVIDDPFLTGISGVIFDEYHERSLEADAGLAFALEIQKTVRADLRLLIMSATLDSKRLSAFFDTPHLIQSKGRSYPVVTHYVQPKINEPITSSTVEVIHRALKKEEGSLLVFLPGAGEIERAAQILREAYQKNKNIIVAPLYGALDLKAQDLAISAAPEGCRKIVLATSIAESSLTIDGIRVVIDCGFSRVPRFDPSTGLTRLETMRVSQASAEQRRGRAGRLSAGACYRLWAEGQTRAFPAFQAPEILEADLSPFLLQCLAFGTADINSLSFLDPPPKAALQEAKKLLEELDALDAHGLTSDGKKLANMSLHPRLAHMLIKAASFGSAPLAAEIATLLTENNLGGTDIHLTSRLEQWRKDRSERGQRARQLKEQFLNQVSNQETSKQLDVGEILSFAYPDRVAFKRENKRGEYLLANGKGAYLDPHDILAKEQCLVIAHVQGHEKRARILLGEPLKRTQFETLMKDHIQTEETYDFDPITGRIKARRIKRYEALILEESPLAFEAEKIPLALSHALKMHGLRLLDHYDILNHFLQRLSFLQQFDQNLWPDLDEAKLSNNTLEWLMPFVPRISSLQDITAPALKGALYNLLSYDLQKKLDEDAPENFTAPTGQSFNIDYSQKEAPSISVRVQSLFGVTSHPMLANGRVALVIELLSPAQRPIQITKNLPSFWAGTWADVKKDMKAQYPKHVWPDDPANAAPTTRAKPRGQ